MKDKVSMWFAYDENGCFIDIDEADYQKDYVCPSCGNIVKPRAKDSDIVTSHFYHLNKGQCNGEAAIHKYWKENYIQINQKIVLPKIGRVTCIDKKTELSINTPYGIYQPDLVIKTDNEKYKYIIFEMNNTNKKSIREYQDKWKHINKIVFEIDVNNINRNNINYDKGKIIFDPQREVELRKVKNEIYKLNENYRSYKMYEEISKSISLVYRMINGVGVRRTTIEDLIDNIPFEWKDRSTFFEFVLPLKRELEKLIPYGV